MRHTLSIHTNSSLLTPLMTWLLHDIASLRMRFIRSAQRGVPRSHHRAPRSGCENTVYRGIGGCRHSARSQGLTPTPLVAYPPPPTPHPLSHYISLPRIPSLPSNLALFAVRYQTWRPFSPTCRRSSVPPDGTTHSSSSTLRRPLGGPWKTVGQVREE